MARRSSTDPDAATTAPGAPGNQGTVAAGAAARASATPATQRVPHWAVAIRAGASTGPATSATTAAMPTSVMAGTTGDTRTLAGSEYTGRAGWIRTRIGVQKSCAVSGMASSWAAGRGIIRPRVSTTVGPAVTSPRVAATDSTKAKDTESQGSTARRTMTDTISSVSETLPRPERTAATPTAPMTAARRTLGSGRTSRTNATSETTAPTPAGSRGSRSTRSPRKANATT